MSTNIFKEIYNNNSRKHIGGTPRREVEDYRDNIYRDIAISWALHSMKNILGLNIVRKKVIKSFFPDIKNISKIETFDAFQSEEKLLAYIRKIMKVEPYVVFTASNQAEEVELPETHYQSFLLDNITKQVFAIDPARKGDKDGIYTPFVSNITLKPFFEDKGYEFNFIKMTNPAQTSKRDVFCQSWSLYILLQVLKKGIHIVKLPKLIQERYGVLLDFYKEILDIPTIPDILNAEYKRELKINKTLILEDLTEEDYKELLKINPTYLLKQMKKKDMM